MNNGIEQTKRQGERNPAASLQQRLRNHAKAAGDDVSLVLIRYLNERFLYRLSISPYREVFILRGATLFTLWADESHRKTRDIDLLATGDSSPAMMQTIIIDICRQEVEADGIIFLTETLNIEERSEGRAYPGLHVEMTAALATARLRLELDIAFGEAISPPPSEVMLPVLLSLPAPQLRAYQRDTAVAEKCEALVKLGIPNTRMKDFYDLWYLSRTYPFAGAQLQDALHTTFTRRGTAFPPEGLPIALTDEFALDLDKQRQWNAFLGKATLTIRPKALFELIAALRAYLQPPLAALTQDNTFEKHWSPQDAEWRQIHPAR